MAGKTFEEVSAEEYDEINLAEAELKAERYERHLDELKAKPEAELEPDLFEHESVTRERRRRAALEGLAQEQLDAVAQIEEWWAGREKWSTPQIFRMFGYAGSGKTTVASRVPDVLGTSAQFAAFTGKAASVLSNKGCHGASTIHSLLYTPSVEPVIDPKTGKAVMRDDGRPQTRLAFERKDPWEGTPCLADTPLFIVDEVSMVSTRLARDLISIGRPILVLGDPEQLGPIGSEESELTARRPDVMLRQVHRNVGQVLKLATQVRNADPESRSLLPPGVQAGEVSISDLLEYDQVLCWKNDTRWGLIRKIRARLGRPVAEPVEGDTIMFLSNRPEQGLFNGMQAKVVGVVPDPKNLDCVLLECVDDADNSLGIPRVHLGGFHSRKAQAAVERDLSRDADIMPATFANAVTVHKSQGSEWPRVALINETRGMRAMEVLGNGKSEAEAGLVARRWLYTGITRASDEILVVIPHGLTDD